MVPTDFSECADNALKQACQIAQKQNSEIHLIHVGVFPFYTKDAIGKDILSKLKSPITQSIEELLSQRKEIARSYSIEIQTHFVFGNFISSLIDYDESENFDLVVMGSYGASGKQEWFIGSNTQKLIRNLSKNVLVIKGPNENLSLKNAMFPSNLTEKDQEAFVKFLEFLKPYNIVKMHILSINTASYFTQPAPLMMELLDDFKKLALGIKCTTYFLSDYSVEAGIRHFSDENKIDIIGISNLVKHPIKRFFQGSNVEMLINHSDLPVLVIGQV